MADKITDASPAILGWLLSHSYGHSEAVAVPDRVVGPGPRGPFPAGVQDLLDLLVRSYGSGRRPAVDQWAFLIGAPGNGKSEALRALAAGLAVTLNPRTPGSKAPRGYTCLLPTSAIPAMFINDASISREESPTEGSLTRDIVEAGEIARKGNCLVFANVNRGVLVEEVHKQQNADLPADEATGLAAELLPWLDRVASGAEGGDPSQAYYKTRSFSVAGRMVLVNAVVLDSTSLFEPRPGRDGRAVEYHADLEPSVAPYRPVGGVEGAREDSTAAKLLLDVISPERWEAHGCDRTCPAAEGCPFRANLKWLRDEKLRGSFLAIARAAEVASGRRMTYRDLLGHFALSLLGKPEPEWQGAQDACAWVREQYGEAPVSARAAALLVRHRIYYSVFPPPNPMGDAWRPGRGRQAAQALGPVIVEDFGKEEQGIRAETYAPAFGVLDPCKAVDGWGGDRFKVLDAAEAMHIEPPTPCLLREGTLPEAAAGGIELLLDDAVMRLLGAGGANRRERQRDLQARRWRTVLLLRQVGLAKGQFSDRGAVDIWLQGQAGVLGQGDQGPLLQGLQSMLLPKRGSLALAPFRPRTRSFNEALPGRTVFLLRPAADLSVELRSSKDGLQAILKLNSDGSRATGVPIPVDLSLAREALVALDELGGFSDLPDRALARVERARASLISHGRLSRSHPPLHLTDRDGRLYVVRGQVGSASLQQVRR